MWPKPGYWTPNETTLVVTRCTAPALDRCLGGRLSECGEGYTNQMCAYCDDQFYWDTGQLSELPYSVMGCIVHGVIHIFGSS